MPRRISHSILFYILALIALFIAKPNIAFHSVHSVSNAHHAHHAQHAKSFGLSSSHHVAGLQGTPFSVGTLTSVIAILSFLFFSVIDI